MYFTPIVTFRFVHPSRILSQAYHWTHRTVIIIKQFTYYNIYITNKKHIDPQTIHTYQYIWHVQNHEVRVNSKYNHADSKVTYLASLSRCHKYIFNESSIPSFEIRVNLYEPMTSVSGLNYNIISLIYIGPLLKVLKCYISIIIFLLKILFFMVMLCKKLDTAISSYSRLYFSLYLPSYLPFPLYLVCGF